MGNLFARLLKKWGACSTLPGGRLHVESRAKFRPCLEILECRTVPAQITWTGDVSNAWNNNNNWVVTQVGAGDAVQVGAKVIPSNQDDVIIVKPVNAANSPVAANGCSGKTLEVRADARLRIENSLVVTNNVTNHGEINILWSGELRATQVDNHVLIEFIGDAVPGGILGGGIIQANVVNDGALATTGDGAQIIGNLTNKRTMSIAGCINGPYGDLTVTGNFDADPGAWMTVTLSRPNEMGRLVVGGNAKLAGTLSVLQDDPAIVVNREKVYTPVTFGSLEGSFAQNEWLIRGKLKYHAAPDIPNKKFNLRAPDMQGAATSINAQEAVAFNSKVADLTDLARINPQPSDYAVTIVWGDGSTSAGTVQIGEGGEHQVFGSHTYADDNPTETASDVYTISVTITDTGAEVEVEGEAQVDNAAPTDLDLDLSIATINEGGSTTLGGSFADLGVLDTHIVTINWGDGSTPDTISLAAGVTAFSQAHTYADDNPTTTASDVYTITVLVVDDDTGEASASTDVTVNNVAPANLQLSGPATFTEGSTFGGSGTFEDVGIEDTWTALVNYGDGTPPVELIVGQSFSLFHCYDDNGTYTITVTVTDDDGGARTATRTAMVTNVAPTGVFYAATNSFGPPRSVGFWFNPNYDPSNADAAALMFSCDFNGDGIFDAVDVLNTTETWFWIYDNPGTYALYGRIKDKDGGYTDYWTSVIVE